MPTIKKIKRRHLADKILVDKALPMFKSKDSSFGKKTAALGITDATEIKRKLGVALRTRRKFNQKTRKRRGLS